MINTAKASGSVAISAYGATPTATENGMKFSQDLETILSFDLGQFQEILEETLQDLTIQVQILC
jgi:hypothetical protein